MPDLTKLSIKNRTIVIWLTFILVFSFLACVMFVPIPTNGAKEILLVGSGVLFGSIKDIISFFFPSSQDQNQ